MKNVVLTLAFLLSAMTMAQAEEKITVETDSPNVEVDVKEKGGETPAVPAMEEPKKD